MTTTRRKKHRPYEVVAKLRNADAILYAGKDLAKALQALEVATRGACYRGLRSLGRRKETVNVQVCRAGRCSEKSLDIETEDLTMTVQSKGPCGHPDASVIDLAGHDAQE